MPGVVTTGGRETQKRKQHGRNRSGGMQRGLSTWPARSAPAVRAVCLGRSAKPAEHLHPPSCTLSLPSLRRCAGAEEGLERCHLPESGFLPGSFFFVGILEPLMPVATGLGDLLPVSNCLALRRRWSGCTQNSTGSAKGELQARGCCACSIWCRPCTPGAELTPFWFLLGASRRWGRGGPVAGSPLGD